MKKKVYLSGPMGGLTYEQAQGWRTDVSNQLDSSIVATYSPLRGVRQTIGNQVMGLFGNEKDPLTTGRGILIADHYDVQTSDAILVNLLDAKERSIGTISEVAWAFAYRKPIVLVMEAADNVHDHAFIRQMADFTVTNLQEAIRILKVLLHPDV